MANYGTNATRVSVALAAGAFTGGIAILVPYCAIAMFEGFRSQHLRSLPVLIAIALVMWSAGLVVFGAPLWWLLHRAKRCTWRIAAIVGAILPLLVYVGLRTVTLLAWPESYGPAYLTGDPAIDAKLWAEARWSEVLVPLFIAATGMTVALVIWRIAYRPLDEPA